MGTWPQAGQPGPRWPPWPGAWTPCQWAGASLQGHVQMLKSSNPTEGDPSASGQLVCPREGGQARMCLGAILALHACAGPCVSFTSQSPRSLGVHPAVRSSSSSITSFVGPGGCCAKADFQYSLGSSDHRQHLPLGRPG